VCGFIGVGSQGAPMARRMIDSGFDVILWARRASSLEPYKDTPARYAETIAALAREVDHVGVCVVTDADVRDVCQDLIPAMRAGGLIAIHATVHPETCRKIQIDAAECGVRVVDAPVSGGPHVAEAGELTVMVGGDEADVALARPIFETFGRRIIHLGAVGAGQHGKLINNTLLTANLGMAHEALAAGERLGLARDALVELLLHSSGRSSGLEVRANLAAPERFRRAGNLLAKDVRLLGEVLGADNPVFRPLRASADQFLRYVLGEDEDAWEAEISG
jgi:3-hydroxyisobutyrate dehydrogenase-like beta-hydroxyacid dehydrogenase